VRVRESVALGKLRGWQMVRGLRVSEDVLGARSVGVGVGVSAFGGLWGRRGWGDVAGGRSFGKDVRLANGKGAQGK